MADHDALVHVPRQYQQSSLLPWAMVESLVARAPNPGPLERQFVRRPRTLFGAYGTGAPDASGGSSLPVRVPGGHKARITRAVNKPASAVTNLPSARSGAFAKWRLPPVSKTTYENKHSSVPGRRGRDRGIRP